MITAPILPYVLLAAVSATSLSGMAGYLFGRSDGKALERAAAARDAEVVAKVADAAQQAAAREIAAIDVKHTTIRQTIEAKTRENSLYRDCVHADGVLDALNQALTGTAADGQLPAADGTGRHQLRSDHAQAGGGGRAISQVPNRSTGGGR